MLQVGPLSTHLVHLLLFVQFVLWSSWDCSSLGIRGARSFVVFFQRGDVGRHFVRA